MSQPRIFKLINEIDSIPAKQSTGKSLKDLIAVDSYFADSFLCNETDEATITGEVDLIWDDFNSCPGLYFENHESFLNIYNIEGQEDDDKWPAYLCSEEGFSRLKQAFEFFTA